MTTETEKPNAANDPIIRALINRPYETPHERPCWAFARDVLALMAIDLPESPRTGLIRVARPVIGGVVMFAAGFDWHCGVIWPDGLHFIHAMPPCLARPTYFEIRQEQLQDAPWRQIIEGYYLPKDQSPT
jgi:hypothetical protein